MQNEPIETTVQDLVETAPVSTKTLVIAAAATTAVVAGVVVFRKLKQRRDERLFAEAAEEIANSNENPQK